MMPDRVLILGGSSPLASSIAGNLKQLGIEVILTNRNFKVDGIDSNLRIVQFSVGNSIEKILEDIQPDLVINCIAARNYKISSVISLLRVNSKFPRKLHKITNNKLIPLILISTDSVFFGLKGGYKESDNRFPRNLYSLSKRLGEITGATTKVVRLSFIGWGAVTDKHDKHLLSRLDGLPRNFQYVAPSNYFWNGLDINSAGKLLTQIGLDLIKNLPVPSFIHLHGVGSIPRDEMIGLILHMIGRIDVSISNRPLRLKRDLTLSSENQSYAESLWRRQGFQEIPNSQSLIKEFLEPR